MKSTAADASASAAVRSRTVDAPEAYFWTGWADNLSLGQVVACCRWTVGKIAVRKMQIAVRKMQESSGCHSEDRQERRKLP